MDTNMAIESFIFKCDDLMIAEEGSFGDFIKSIPAKIAELWKKFIAFMHKVIITIKRKLSKDGKTKNDLRDELSKHNSDSDNYKEESSKKIEDLKNEIDDLKNKNKNKNAEIKLNSNKKDINVRDSIIRDRDSKNYESIQKIYFLEKKLKEEEKQYYDLIHANQKLNKSVSSKKYLDELSTNANTAWAHTANMIDCIQSHLRNVNIIISKLIKCEALSDANEIINNSDSGDFNLKCWITHDNSKANYHKISVDNALNSIKSIKEESTINYDDLQYLSLYFKNVTEKMKKCEASLGSIKDQLTNMSNTANKIQVPAVRGITQQCINACMEDWSQSMAMVTKVTSALI